MTALADSGSSPQEVAHRLGITTTTLCTNVTRDSAPKTSEHYIRNAVCPDDHWTIRQEVS
jgi:hypothetical protein